MIAVEATRFASVADEWADRFRQPSVRLQPRFRPAREAACLPKSAGGGRYIQEGSRLGFPGTSETELDTSTNGGGPVNDGSWLQTSPLKSPAG